MTENEICKYLIAFLYDVDSSVVLVKKGFSKYIAEFTSKESGNLIDSKIKIKGNRLIWGNLKGRWRNDKKDSVITYKIYGNKIKIREKFYTGGFLVKEFKKQ